MLAAEMAQHVLARRILAAPGHQTQHERRHQRVVERSDRAIGGQVSHWEAQPLYPSTRMAFDFPAFSRISRIGL